MTHPILDEAAIRETAYLFWLDEGQPSGRDQEHWLKAIDALSVATPKTKPVRKAAAKPRAPKAAAPAKATPKSPAKSAVAAKPRARKNAPKAPSA